MSKVTSCVTACSHMLTGAMVCAPIVMEWFACLLSMASGKNTIEQSVHSQLVLTDLVANSGLHSYAIGNKYSQQCVYVSYIMHWELLLVNTDC